MQVLALLADRGLLLPAVDRCSRRWLDERIRKRLRDELAAFQRHCSVRELSAGPIPRLLSAQQLGLLDRFVVDCSEWISATLEKIDACRCVVDACRCAGWPKQCTDDLNNAAVKLCWLVDRGLVAREALPIAAARLRELGLAYLCADGNAHTAQTDAPPFHSNPFYHLLVGNDCLPDAPLVSPHLCLLHAAAMRFSEAAQLGMARCYARCASRVAYDLRLVLICFGHPDAALAVQAAAVDSRETCISLRLFHLGFVGFSKASPLSALSAPQVALLLRWYAAELYDGLSFLRNALFYAHVNHASCCRAALRSVWQSHDSLHCDPDIVPP
jgi:hypothetical protein